MVMKHRMHQFKSGGFFHCAGCPCEKQLTSECTIANESFNVPEENLKLLSKLGVKISYMGGIIND